MALTRLGPNNTTNITGINLTSQVTGTLPVANGGTALTSGFVNGGVNTPYWYAYGHASGQATTSSTFAKMQATAVHDSGSNYDDTNYRFTVPSGQAGKYWVSCATQPYNTSSVANGAQIVPYVNGSGLGNTYNASIYQISNFRNHWIMWSGILNLSVGDYVEIYAYTTFSSGAGGLAYGKWGGYKIIE